MIESIATAGLGFLAGTAAGGPLAGAGGAMAGLMGKAAFKEAVIAAAKKKAAGEAINAAENKLLREAAGLAGAVAATYGQNLATGAADIYGELREQYYRQLRTFPTFGKGWLRRNREVTQEALRALA
jgi:hypothetical protein